MRHFKISIFLSCTTLIFGPLVVFMTHDPLHLALPLTSLALALFYESIFHEGSEGGEKTEPPA